MRHLVALLAIILIGCVPSFGAETAAPASGGSPAFSMSVPAETSANVMKFVDVLLVSNACCVGRAESLRAVAEEFVHVDSFFDTPERKLLGAGAQLYRRSLEDIPGASANGKKKKNDDYIYFVGGTGLPKAFEAKKYKRVKHLWGKHKLLGQIKRSERELFAQDLGTVGVIRPMRLKRVLELSSAGRKVELYAGDEPIATIELAGHEAESMGSSVLFSSIVFRHSALDAEGTAYASELSEYLKRELTTKYPELALRHSTPYSMAYSGLKQEVFALDFKLRYPVFVRLFHSVVWLAVGVAAIVVIFRKRLL